VTGLSNDGRRSGGATLTGSTSARLAGNCSALTRSLGVRRGGGDTVEAGVPGTARGVKLPLLLTADAAVIAALAAAMAAAALRGEDARGAAALSPVWALPPAMVEGRLKVEPRGAGGRVNFDAFDNPAVVAAVGVVAAEPGLASMAALASGVPPVAVAPPAPASVPDQ
jgi:hypothetical protein